MRSIPVPQTVVIPAYDEEDRIGQTLEVLLSYLGTHHPDAEVIVVCGGSDQTASIARAAGAGSPVLVKVIESTRTGKGAAVRAGVAAASGEYILFTDADLAYAPSLFAGFLARLERGADIAIAQRTPNTRYTSRRRLLTTALARFVVSNLVVRGIADSQAGLKAFRRDVALDLFSRQRVDRFLFDVEILLLAKRAGYRIEQIYVHWSDKSGSTVRPVRDLIHAAFDMTGVAWRLAAGRYPRPDSDLRPTT